MKIKDVLKKKFSMKKLICNAVVEDMNIVFEVQNIDVKHVIMLFITMSFNQGSFN